MKRLKKRPGRENELLGPKFSAQLYVGDEQLVEELARVERRTKSKMVRELVARALDAENRRWAR